MPIKRETAVKRFMGRLVLQPNGCKEYRGKRSKDGYGMLRFEGKDEYAHRLAWRLEKGDIPPGLGVLHQCDNPPCGNTDHLFLGTQGDNNRDALAKGRMRRHGPYSSRRKLTLEQVKDIRLSSLTTRVLSTYYGVDWHTINAVRRGKSWPEEAA